jgi:DNA-directed RNA polymerase subunit beta'
VRTDDGIVFTSRVENGEITEHVGERVLGRVALEPVLARSDGTVLFPKNHMFTEKDMQHS